MKEKLRFLGLDVHAETIAVAVAEPEGEVRSLGTISNRAESIRKLIKKLGPAAKLRACYEAGPTGYVVYWQQTGERTFIRAADVSGNGFERLDGLTEYFRAVHDPRRHHSRYSLLPFWFLLGNTARATHTKRMVQRAEGETRKSRKARTVRC
jgi:hypothetical protein